MPDLWGLAAIGAKFALYLGVLAAAGTVFAAVLFPLERWRGLALGFAVLGLAAAGLSFLLRGAMLTGDASGMADPQMLSLLWGTAVGTALVWRLAGLGLLIVGLALGRPGVWLAAAGAIAALWSFVRIGHIPEQEWAGLNIALMLHLLAAAYWIGILTPLRRLAAAPAARAEAAEVGWRFGLIAMAVIPLLIIVGVVMAYALVGSLSKLVGEPYGQALLLKLGFVSLLLGLGAMNKLRFVPRLRRGERAAAGHLVAAITVEWVVVLLVLAITAVLTSTLSLPM